MAGQVLHPKYLPFTSEMLLEHFAPVTGKAPDDRHLHYFQDSLLRLADHLALAEKGEPTHPQIRIGRQLEKDERFWTCLLYTSPSPRDGLLSRMPSSA